MLYHHARQRSAAEVGNVIRRALDAAGALTGAALSPLAALATRLRHERLFHPEGACYRARVLAASIEQPQADLARRLAGEALVRFSSALWHDERRPDILGVAVRFQARPGAPPSGGDQDLLLATVRSPVTLAGALLTTQRRDFLANDYYGVSPFEVEGVGRSRLRLVAHGSGAGGAERFARLAGAVARGLVGLRLEIKVHGEGRWRPLVLLEICAPLPVAQAALRFDPFRAGRGLRPAGFIQHVRRPVYAWAQRARRGASGAREAARR